MKTFKKWKGTPGMLQIDIAYDLNERHEKLYSVQVFTHKETIATVYGKTIDEIDANSKLVASSKDSIELLLSIHGEMVRVIKNLKGNTKLVNEHKTLVFLKENIEYLINKTL